MHAQYDSDGILTIVSTDDEPDHLSPWATDEEIPDPVYLPPPSASDASPGEYSDDNTGSPSEDSDKNTSESVLLSPIRPQSEHKSMMSSPSSAMGMFRSTLSASNQSSANDIVSTRSDLDSILQPVTLRGTKVMKAFSRPVGDYVCCKKRCMDKMPDAIVCGFRRHVFAHGKLPMTRARAMDEALQNVQGNYACDDWLEIVLGCSRNFLHPKVRANTYGDSNRRRGKILVTVMAWFDLLLPVIDKMPDEVNYQISAPDRSTVWKWYSEDCKKYAIFRACSRQYFLQVWAQHYSIVKLRKYMRFTRCELCVKLRTEKSSRSISRREREKLVQKLQSHFDQIRRYRARSAQNACVSTLQPDVSLSIAMDGAAICGNGLPRVAEYFKKEDGYRLKVKVMIVMVHGRALHYYVMPLNIQGNPDTSIECLQRTLKTIEKRDGRLPPKFYLQQDNCFREGKNTAVIQYLSWLVERGVFEVVYVSFHPTGHTHNECDQCASCINLAIRNNDVLCRCKLVDLLEQSYNPKPDVCSG